VGEGVGGREVLQWALPTTQGGCAFRL